MSKKYKKNKQKIPWWLIGLGGLVLIAIAWGMAGRGSGAGTDSGGGTPVLAVDQQRIDFGDVKLNTNLTFTIKVTNTGNGTLRFTEMPYIEVLEGC